MKNSLRRSETRAQSPWCLFLMSTVFWPFSTTMCESPVLRAKLPHLWEGSKLSWLLDIKVYVSRMIKCLTLSPWVKTVTITRGVTTQLSPFYPTQTDFIAFQSPTFEHPLNWLHLRINLSWKAQTGPQEQTHRSRLNHIFALRWNKNLNFSRLR